MVDVLHLHLQHTNVSLAVSPRRPMLPAFCFCFCFSLFAFRFRLKQCRFRFCFCFGKLPALPAFPRSLCCACLCPLGHRSEMPGKRPVRSVKMSPNRNIGIATRRLGAKAKDTNAILDFSKMAVCVNIHAPRLQLGHHLRSSLIEISN